MDSFQVSGFISEAFLFDFFPGTFTSLLPAYIATITPVDKLGARLGRLNPYFHLAFLF
jgi:hypothetical protein